MEDRRRGRRDREERGGALQPEGRGSVPRAGPRPAVAPRRRVETDELGPPPRNDADFFCAASYPKRFRALFTGSRHIRG